MTHTQRTIALGVTWAMILTPLAYLLAGIAGGLR